MSSTQISVETCIMCTRAESHHALLTRATQIYEERDSMHLTKNPMSRNSSIENGVREHRYIRLHTPKKGVMAPIGGN